MQTNRCETRSISIAAPPAAVLAYVGDARNLPEWAPDFARSVRPQDDHWLVDTGGGEAAFDVVTSDKHGTMDILLCADPRQGARSRVIPNGDGSEYLFTLVFAGADEAAIDEQMTIVEAELERIRARCVSTSVR